MGLGSCWPKTGSSVIKVGHRCGKARDSIVSLRSWDPTLLASLASFPLLSTLAQLQPLPTHTLSIPNISLSDFY